MNHWLGLDVGGANLKIARANGWANCVPFELWRRSGELAEQLRDMVASADSGGRDGVAVTMTGELADCFANRAEGVAFIVRAALRAGESRCVVFYSTRGTWLSGPDAMTDWPTVAAANWHALARLAHRSVTSFPAILVDVGSTTTDIVPLDAAGVAARGTSDWTRLLAGELVYTGIERTPLCAVLPRLRRPHTDANCGSGGNAATVMLAAELFATMQDVYVVLGELAEDAGDRATADGRPRTLACSRERLRRSLCAEPSEVSDALLLELARQASEAQVAMIAEALRRASQGLGVPRQVVLSGHGTFVARRALECIGWDAAIDTLGDLPTDALRCATACAVASLADEHQEPNG